MSHHVTVHQLASGGGIRPGGIRPGGYLNVRDLGGPDAPLGVAVWTVPAADAPVLLLTSADGQGYLMLAAFASRPAMDEWLEDHRDEWRVAHVWPEEDETS